MEFLGMGLLGMGLPGTVLPGKVLPGKVLPGMQACLVAAPGVDHWEEVGGHNQQLLEELRGLGEEPRSLGALAGIVVGVLEI